MQWPFQQRHMLNPYQVRATSNDPYVTFTVLIIFLCEHDVFKKIDLHTQPKYWNESPNF